MQFIFLLGVVSLFADVTYEGGRSILGPFFLHLGATASIVGVASGLGEMVGYSFRLLSGYIADKTKQYWGLMFIGYTLNLFAFPLLAFVGRWDLAVGMVVAERLGKALRHPSRDTLLSFATARIGAGLGFGFHEAMDQIGAVAGPLFVFLLLLISKQFSTTFALLFLPASLSLFSLLIAYRLFPQPQTFPGMPSPLVIKGLSRFFPIYLISAMLVSAGYADFPLIAFHIQKHQFASPLLIPIAYALAMGVDALSALYFGRLFDRMGISSLVLAI
ncbi:MAG: MFS transporter, partial [bacterium]